MHNVVSKVLLVVVIVLIALFTYKTMRTPSIVSATVEINPADQSKSDISDIKKIEGIVKEYLLNNPEVIIQSVENLQQRKMQEMESKTDQYIKDNKSEIEGYLSSPVLGNPNGDIIIVAFYDYNCGYCKKGDQFVEQLIKLDNNVKVILKVFPILGSSSNYAASISLAVFKTNPDKFRDIHIGLINMKPINGESVEKLLVSHGLDTELIAEEIKKEEVKSIIDKNIQLAQKLKIQGVPAYIINGKLVPGMVDLQQLQKMISDIRGQSSK